MNILAISGSGRADSTNTAMLRAVARIARPAHEVTVFAEVAGLPVFSPDLEAGPLPETVAHFVGLIERSDAVIISSPEYVRAIPGGMKNAIDWLVSRDEIITKPIVLMHCSHRGDDMLEQLRLVLATVSQRFREDLFLRFHFMKLSPGEIATRMASPGNQKAVAGFLKDLAEFCGQDPA
ncbi:NADPH-dependent FMN reductase [Frigidibacter sp. ROC022]|uniref:NADPH-dependent FMN reductase n=1 Tax=Frigidibacter sp. ROC022 TaxID=2971796 RepID=UPI00215A7072|nr:NADPH-dependent FMN reductase [Frigidibacter sp. ROC022]MCR8725333.1 NAD(P)H-dependent oxidoreductase [Frigidibacter sp. ROC022]